ncbi:MAG: transposase [Pyrinomonadaceae bacterium]
MEERKQYTKEFKEVAVRLVTEQGRTIADAAQGLGISRWTMSRWVKAAKHEGVESYSRAARTAPMSAVIPLAKLRNSGISRRVSKVGGGAGTRPALLSPQRPMSKSWGAG